MIIKKIGVITGGPYGDFAIGKILLIDERDEHYYLTDSGYIIEQANYSDSTGANGSYRKATEMLDKTTSTLSYFKTMLTEKF